MREAVATSVDMRIKTLSRIVEGIEKKTQWGIRRFESRTDHKAQMKADLDGESIELYTEREAIGLFGMPQNTIIQGNITLNEGLNEFFTILCSSGGTKFDNTNSYLGVGDSTIESNATQTGLQASTNKFYKEMDATYPTYGTSQKATWKSTFETTEANFDWNEFTLANGNSDSDINFNRRVAQQGTKQSDQIWELTQEIGVS